VGKRKTVLQERSELLGGTQKEGEEGNERTEGPDILRHDDKGGVKWGISRGIKIGREKRK